MPDPPANSSSEKSHSEEIRRIRSEDLFQGGRILVITHAGTEYRLIKTRNDKLMLQK